MFLPNLFLLFCSQPAQWGHSTVGLQNVHIARQVWRTWWSSSWNLLP